MFDNSLYRQIDELAIYFQEFETLVKEFDKFRLLLRETLLISRDDRLFNRIVNSISLELFPQLSTI